MAACEKEYAMEGCEAYEEEVKKDVKEEEEDLCSEESSISYHLYTSRPTRQGEANLYGSSRSRRHNLVQLQRRASRNGEFQHKQPHPAFHSLARQRSTNPSHISQQQGIPLRRSKSCGEGRSSAPSDEFNIRRSPGMKLPENGVRILCDCTDDAGKCKDSEELDPRAEENFKCGVLCLFLPAFSKKKQVEASRDEQGEQRSTVSRAASLEKFEYGSWSSSVILDVGDEAGESYFDLPLELISSCTDDANSAVKMAFVYDEDRKVVLKKSTSNLTPRKSHEASNRHVRFSTSTHTLYPTLPTAACITPRLLKAREDFDAFLEAQCT
ncbi:uncharacterized protein LOC103707202 [Phoenix dactylifera]|uniref:Uncharacterized protein LOC103707202 n=1 Tax=Phoenix dactylifera TaxID=42345 RepID=A0A8B9AE29_PHODC|nr:uncharacterized protein LOC103707202 [Phoenix dactylifera]